MPHKMKSGFSPCGDGRKENSVPEESRETAADLLAR
jgi:hypothetical protein